MRLVLFFLVWLNFSEAKSGSGHEVQLLRFVEQTEANFSLTKQAAESILSKYDFKLKNRTDYYFDIFDGHQLVINSTGKFRFRMKSINNKWVLQANKRISFSAVTCESGIKFFVKEKIDGEADLSSRQGMEVVNRSSDVEKALYAKPQDANKIKFRDFHKTLDGLDIPFREELLGSAKEIDSWFFVPTHHSFKNKYSKKFSTESGVIEVSVTFARDFLGEREIQEKFEIEFQRKDIGFSQEFFRNFICEFMSEVNLKSEDIWPPRTDVLGFTLGRLQDHWETFGLKKH